MKLQMKILIPLFVIALFKTIQSDLVMSRIKYNVIEPNTAMTKQVNSKSTQIASTLKEGERKLIDEVERQIQGSDTY